MQSVIKGEKRYIAMQVTRRKTGAFTIATASYNVNNIQIGSCEIDQSAKEIYFLLDTTDAKFIRDRSYVAEFTVTITGLSKIIKGKVTINIR
jgi:hypothetical protein